MSRPLYETAEDRDREQAAANLMRKQWDVTMLKLADEESVDFIVLRKSEVRCVLEYKWRDIRRLEFPTYAISEAKINRCIELAELLGVPFVMCPQWKDGGPYYAVIKNTGRVAMGGRTDRGDKADVECMSHYPIEMFEPVRREK